jgi:hypothetical protein
MAATDKEVHALHRYLIWSIHMREEALRLNAADNVPEDITEKRLWLIRPFMWISLWLALLYVVAEGYQDLGLSDLAIDDMLASPNVDLLRRFRNGAFHYQRDYFDPRFRNVISSAEVQDWAVRLHDEFRRFFLEWFQAKGIEVEIIEDSEA